MALHNLVKIKETSRKRLGQGHGSGKVKNWRSRYKGTESQK
jgi:hypothetical protein